MHHLLLLLICASLLLQKLRLYSCAGRQLAILSLQGPPVALVAAGGVQG